MNTVDRFPLPKRPFSCQYCLNLLCCEVQLCWWIKKRENHLTSNAIEVEEDTRETRIGRIKEFHKAATINLKLGSSSLSVKLPTLKADEEVLQTLNLSVCDKRI